MAQNGSNGSGGFVVIDGLPGHTVIPAASRLTRLNYFDGKFLRADDLRVEQDGLRNLVHLSNTAGGSGVVSGFSCARDGEMLDIGPGLAIERDGHLIRLPGSVTINILELIEEAKNGPPQASEAPDGSGEFDECVGVSGEAPGTVLDEGDLWVITVSHAEAYCGQEDVYGNLCEEACVTSTNRPFIREGVLIRAEAYSLRTPPIESLKVLLDSEHRRSQVATAYFLDEETRRPHLISADGLASPAWCRGAEAESADQVQGVPIAVVALTGSTIDFLDAWTARRERMVAPPQAWWARRMRMRPLNSFLAQVSQFQCQLSSLVDLATGIKGGEDPCAEPKAAAAEALGMLEEIQKVFADKGGDLLFTTDHAKRFELVAKRLAAASAGGGGAATDRLLLRAGFVTLPSAGYLPVVPGSTVSINEQVRRYMGEGVDLRFCAVRADFVPHALEEAQHMERISMVEGIDWPDRKPRVDILVPEGEVAQTVTVPAGRGYEMDLGLYRNFGVFLPGGGATPVGNVSTVHGLSQGANLRQTSQPFYGAARGEELPTGGAAFHFAGYLSPDRGKATIGDGLIREPGKVIKFASDLKKEVGTGFTTDRTSYRDSVWVTMRVEEDVLGLSPNAVTKVAARFVYLRSGPNGSVIIDAGLDGWLTVLEIIDSERRRARLSGELRISFSATGQGTLPEGTSSIDEEVLFRSDGAGTVLAEAQDLHHFPAMPTEFRFKKLWEHVDAAVATAYLIVNKPTDDSIEVLKSAAGQIKKLPFFETRLRVDAGVADPAHPAHQASILALGEIAGAMNDPAFAEIPSQLLFPAPAANPEGELVVHGTRDWVLFHRRRDKQCGIEAPAPAAVEPKTYRVYHIRVDEKRSREMLAQALRQDAGANINRFQPKAVTDVAFGPGVATMTTPAADVVSDWKTDVPGSAQVVYAAIATRSDLPDEGEAIARGRMISLGSALSAVAPASDDPVLEVLPDKPNVLPAGSTDGVIVVATEGVAVTCHEVWRMAADEEREGELLNRLRGSDVKHLREVLTSLKTESVGKAVQFKGEEVYAQSDRFLHASWLAAGDGAPRRVLVITQRDDDEVPIQIAMRQGAVLAATATGAQDGLPDVVPEQTTLLVEPCPVVTVLVVDPPPKLVCNDVYVRDDFMKQGEFETTVDRIRRGSEDLAGMLSKELDYKHLRAVDLSGDGSISAAEAQDLWSEWNKFLITEFGGDAAALDKEKSVVVTPVAVSPQGASDADHDVHILQAQGIGNVVSSDQPAIGAKYGQPQFPATDCPAITLIFLQKLEVPPAATTTNFLFMASDDMSSGDVGTPIRFKERGALVPDQGYKLAQEKFKASGKKFKTLTLAAAAVPPLGKQDPRLKALAVDLKSADLVLGGFKVNARKFNATESRSLKKRGDGVTEVFILQ